MSKCEFCDGSGERLIAVKNPLTNRKKLVSELCICRRSQFISDRFPVLGFLEDEYMPMDKLDKRLSINRKELKKSPNLIIRCSDYREFYMHIKSFIMKGRFVKPPLEIFCGKSIEVLQRFYLPQKDGFTDHLSATMNYDLMVIELGTMEKNNQLNTCIAEVVNMRKHRKPIWFYLTRQSLDACKQEYSAELDEMLKSYTKITIESDEEGPTNNDDLSDFGGL